MFVASTFSQTAIGTLAGTALGLALHAPQTGLDFRKRRETGVIGTLQSREARAIAGVSANLALPAALMLAAARPHPTNAAVLAASSAVTMGYWGLSAASVLAEPEVAPGQPTKS